MYYYKLISSMSKAIGMSYTPLLDTYTGAAAAYSLRKMRTAYTGYAIRVRRSSDGTSQDIGFKADGTLDTTSLLSFVGAGNGFISIWYDQSENNRNLTQATSADQPQIVTSGSLYLDSSNKPRIKGYTSNTTALRMNGSINVNQPYSSFVLAEYISTTSPTNFPYVGDLAGFNYELFSDNVLIGGIGNNNHRIYANTSLYNNNISVANNTKYLYTALFNGTSSQLGVNNNFVTGNAGTSIFYRINLFNTREPLGPAALNGYIYEAIFYLSNQSTNFTPINTNINSYYSIY
jgi:hypothetical protein